MKEDLLKLVNIIKLANSRGAYTLQEASVIYQLLLDINKCPVLTNNKDKKKDLEVEEMK